MTKNPLKIALAQDQPVIGTFLKSNDPAVAEVIALAGFDFVIIDNEHTAMNIENMTNLIRASELRGMTPTVRVRQKNAADILQALDAGALGVQVPQVNTEEEARLVASWSKYSPEGDRGYAASQRSALYGNCDPAEYARQANEDTLVVSYCETLECINNLDSILTVTGIDVIFIGPFDLSQSLGVIGQTGHPKVLAAIEEITAKTRAAGKAVGIIAGSVESTVEWIAKGIRYFAVSSDLGMIASMGKQLVTGIRK